MIKFFNSESNQRPAYRWVPVLLGLLTVLFLPLSSFAHGQGDLVAAKAKSIGAQQKSRAEDLTLQLSQMISAYHGAEKAAEKSGLEEKLIPLAEERQELLLEILEIDPAAVLRMTLPDNLRENLPLGVQKLLEQQLEIDGKLEVFHEDYDDPGKSRYQYFLKTPSGQQITLHFPSRSSSMVSGDRLRAKGAIITEFKNNEEEEIQHMAVEDGLLMLAGNEGGSSNVTSGISVLENTLGIQSTLVMLVNFQNKPDNKPWSLEYAESLVLGDVNSFYIENSYQQTSLEGDVIGWYTLQIDPTCSGPEISQAADAAALANGFDPSNYVRLIYVYPSVTSCGWSGKGTIGGLPSRSWINGRFKLDIVAHELGHNFGLLHSNALECGAATLGSSCNELEYGDVYDIMGNETAAHLNSYQKERLGWLDPGGVSMITTVDTDGTFSLGAYESTVNETKVLKVPKSADSSTGEMTWYYLEFRQPIGFDSFLSNNGNMTQGILAHLGNSLGEDSSLLLDMTPSSSSLGDFFDPALVVGGSFYDAEAGLTITTDWADDINAIVSVSFDSQGCQHANPGIELAPSVSDWVAAGTSVVYSVTVSNHDGLNCAPSSFEVTADLSAADWEGIVSSTLLVMEPGTSALTELTVTSPIQAVDGYYDFIVQVNNQQALGFSGNQTATYVVQNDTTNEPPVAADDSAETLENTAVAIDVLENDSDPDGDLLSVIQVSQTSKGTVSINEDGTLTFVPGLRAKGQFEFTYTVADSNNNNAIGNVSVMVNKNTGSGGGKGKRN